MVSMGKKHREQEIEQGINGGISESVLRINKKRIKEKEGRKNSSRRTTFRKASHRR